MLIDIAKIRESGEPLALETAFDEASLRWGADKVVSLQTAASVRLRIAATEDLVRVSGRLETVLALICCRCLNQFQRPLEKTLNLDYAPDPPVSREGEELELTYQDLDVGFYRNNELDLSAVVGEQIFLEVPMKPLCREDCQGLCDQCGADLNKGKCGCSHESADPRLAALLDFKKRLNKDN